jgi:hypothetical protein
MAPAHSKLNDASQVADRLTHHIASDPPPIKFMRSNRASKSPADTMYHEFEYRLDNANKKSIKMSKKTLMFENGDAEMWCDWRIKFNDLIRLAPLTTAEHKSNAALTLFKGKALQHFKEYTRIVDNLNDEQGKETRLLGMTIRSSSKYSIELQRNSSQSSTPIAGSASIFATISTLVASSVFVSLWLVFTGLMPAFRIFQGRRTRKASNIANVCQTTNFVTS